MRQCSPVLTPDEYLFDENQPRYSFIVNIMTKFPEMEFGRFLVENQDTGQKLPFCNSGVKYGKLERNHHKKFFNKMYSEHPKAYILTALWALLQPIAAMIIIITLHPA